MILTRTPLRISLFGGGGADLPSYYRREGATVLSAAIDKYVYLAVNGTFTDDYLLKYSEHERVGSVGEIRHGLIREVLHHYGVDPGIEIVSVADIPAGTGLGSSGSFTVGLVLALHAYRHQQLSPQELAAAACHIEIELLGDPVGKQDQYIASHGGIARFDFKPDDTVAVSNLAVDQATIEDLEDHLLLFFTGYSRKATDMLSDQKERSERADAEMLANLDEVVALGQRIEKALLAGDTASFAELMHEHWVRKRGRTSGITNQNIDDWYELGRANGAVGGKLVGAGAGGFLLFYATEPARLRKAMADAGLREVRFGFDFDGAVVLAELSVLSCLVLGGGRGTRLGDLTRDVPKPLVQVAGEPFVHHQLRWLVSEGVTEVAYSIGHLGHRIRDELARRPPAGCSVRFVDEGPDLRGTGGAVRLAVGEEAVGDPFLVLYGDSYLDIDIAAVVDDFEASGCGALMTVYADPGAPHDNARFRDGRVERYDKSEPDPAGAGMEHVDYGLSVLRAATVRRLVPAGATCDLATAFGQLSLEGDLAGHEAANPFFEIGSLEGLRALEAHLTGATR